MSEQILQQILEELKQIKTDQKITNERLTTLESKQHTIYEQTGKLTEYHMETMSRFNELATKEDLTPIKQATLETNVAVKRIELTQEKHERTLDLLSRRSIDHEAEIKRIK